MNDSSSLRDAEEEASNQTGFYKPDVSLDSARDEEEKASGFFSGGGRLVKKGKKNLFLKRMPVSMIGMVVVIFGLGALSFTAMIPEVVAWKENIVSMFGQNSAILNIRSNYLMTRLLTFNSDKIKMSHRLEEKLKKYNINYVETEDVDGKKLKMLVYENSDGKMTPIVGSEKDVGRANALAKAGQEIDIDGKKIKLADTGLTLSNARKTNKQFSIDYDSATFGFTGKNAGWFDSMADAMFKRIIGDDARKQTDIEDPTKEKVDDLLLKNKSSGIDNSELKVSDGEAEDENGNKILNNNEIDADKPLGESGKTYGEIAEGDGSLRTDNPSPEKVSQGLSARALKIAMVGSTVGCAFLRSIGSISSAVGATVNINLRSYASKYLEIADKIKSGKADEVVHEATNNWNKEVETEAFDIDGESVTTTGSVTESPGYNASFSGAGNINENSPGALFSNREYANRVALNIISGGKSGLSEIAASLLSAGDEVTLFKACNVIQGVAGAIDGITDLVSIFTLGIVGGLEEIVTGALKGAALAGSLGLITTVVSIITPTITSWFGSRLPNALLGLNGGYSIFGGAHSLLDAMLQMSTGRYASDDNAVELYGLTKDVEKEWAAYERATLSPFDLTSKYTFFGSIYNSMIPAINKANGGMIVSAVSSAATLTKSSAISLINPSVSAANDKNDFVISLAGKDNCSSLKSVGVAGDFGCNKYSGAYVEELTTMDPDTNYDNMVKYQSFDGVDSYGNPKIRNGSDYAKFIIACVTSDVQPGTMNALVEGYIEGIQKNIVGIAGDGPIANGLVNFGLNFTPFEGFLDALSAKEQLENYKWNSGYACTGNTDDPELNEKIKNFSMYNLTQRAANDMDISETNSTALFLEEYYKENPIDYSIEGQIARVSGMTKEEVSDTLALIEYYNYIANYNPNERYAFGGSVTEEDRVVKFNDDDVFVEKTILLGTIQFADVRNRNFAA